MLNFVRCIFCIYRDDHVALFSSVRVVYYIDWFLYVEASLWTCNESHLVKVYDLFLSVVEFRLLIFCWEFLHLYSSVILAWVPWWCFHHCSSGYWLLLWHELDPWHQNFCMVWACPKKLLAYNFPFGWYFCLLLVWGC